jgi:HEAT repeat protein
LKNRLESSAAEIERKLNADPQNRARLLEARKAACGLGDSKPGRRTEVREKLLALGEAAVPALLRALAEPDVNVRWQAAKALGRLHAPETAPDLVNAMEDDNFGVRWLAAEGLIAMGPSCLGPLLAGLRLDFSSLRMRAGVQHVLCALADGGYYDETIEKLMQVLRDSNPASEIAWVAERALEKLQMGGMRT